MHFIAFFLFIIICLTAWYNYLLTTVPFAHHQYSQLHQLLLPEAMYTFALLIISSFNEPLLPHKKFLPSSSVLLILSCNDDIFRLDKGFATAYTCNEHTKQRPVTSITNETRITCPNYRTLSKSLSLS